jgi:hypothetical protein
LYKVLKEQLAAHATTTVAPSRLGVSVILIALAVWAVITYGPVLFVFGPAIFFDETVSVSHSPLDAIPERFHAHFAQNARDISGQYSSRTRQCKFSYPCTQEDFMAMIQRENLTLQNDLKRMEFAIKCGMKPEDGSIGTFRQWGPGIASYEFFPHSKTATIKASAF